MCIFIDTMAMVHTIYKHGRGLIRNQVLDKMIWAGLIMTSQTLKPPYCQIHTSQ